ncbi:SSI family serine proteinase inhibitor [Kibdelosporangium persicum]|uniref:Serine protease n=1 Tax=Kibdelosporangium persicum TaxID=2698649 RepID=A0ABX2FAZ6_9PSEU|nr:SSI family serine proteinase inhibitor [Kibdelosporangium persicum]NRN68529.1 Serine protease [Kibdelosporangium persicum]
MSGMQSSLKPLAVGACVSALTAAFLVTPASAAPPTLLLSIQDEHTLVVPAFRTLGCDDPDNVTGSHPRREQACKAIESAGGDLKKLEMVSDVNCPMIYDPVTARANGSFRGKRIDFKAVYPNACVAAAESSDVFRW